tara:strand:- start:179 stop:949 length:771 start_codon:yes stop_codon:yes gene_type:complete
MTNLFFSHAWSKDRLGRDNHNRVLNLYYRLKKQGWKIWIDEDQLKYNIDSEIANGIYNSDIVFVFLTENYIIKINESAKNPNARDNCLKEWTYINFCKKIIIPVIMEPHLLNYENWNSGIVSLYIGSTYYIDCTDNNINKNSDKIHNYLIKLKFKPETKNKFAPLKLQICNKLNNSNKSDKYNKNNLIEIYFKKFRSLIIKNNLKILPYSNRLTNDNIKKHNNNFKVKQPIREAPILQEYLNSQRTSKNSTSSSDF